MIRYSFVIAAFLTTLATGSDAIAQSADPYRSGHGALEVFDEAGMSAMPLWIKLWLGLLVLTFLSALFFVRKHLVAQLAIAGFVLSFFATSIIFGALGLPFLSGSIAIGHIIFWTPALVLLLLRRPFLDGRKGQLFRIWSGLMTFVILFSFIFDVRDAISYISHVGA